MHIAGTSAFFISIDCIQWIPATEGSFGDGLWVVGTDIQPGLYRSIEFGAGTRVAGHFDYYSVSDCDWERLSGFGGTYGDEIRPRTGSKWVARIEPTDRGFMSSGCGVWFPIAEPTGTFGDGLWAIPAGLYVSGGNGGVCRAWGENTRTLGGEWEGRGRQVVEVQPETGKKAFFWANGCGEWRPADEVMTSLSSTIDNGTWIVGNEIVPGSYAAPGGRGCIWERLEALTGSFFDEIASGGSDMRQIVTIDARDVGFRTWGCGRWNKID